jgi:hypothetical protein
VSSRNLTNVENPSPIANTGQGDPAPRRRRPARSAAQRGVRYIFGDPGTTELPLMDAFIGDSRGYHLRETVRILYVERIGSFGVR